MCFTQERHEGKSIIFDFWVIIISLNKCVLFVFLLQSDGLIRVNGDSRERDDSVSCPQINVSSSPPKPDTQSQQNEELIVLEASEHQQNVQTISDKENEVIKEEKKCSLSPQEENSKEDTSTTLSVSEPEG